MMLTIVPGAPRASMSATAACMRKNGARRLTATCASNSSGVVSSSVPRVVSPAALTRPSIRPNRVDRAPTEPCACADVGDVGRHEQRLAAAALRQLGGEAPRRRRRGGPVTATVAPASTAAAGDARAHALGAAADQDHPVVQQAVSRGHVVGAPRGVLVQLAGELRGRRRPRQRLPRRARPGEAGVSPSTGWSRSRLVGNG